MAIRAPDGAKKVTGSVSDNMKSRDASASKNTTSNIVNNIKITLYRTLDHLAHSDYSIFSDETEAILSQI